ncbi:hypothetical protein GQ472_04365 [archaeon]|nr:hypothetical protein [archaeon]
MGPESYKILLTPDSNLTSGEYMARIEATCLGKPVKTEAWFRINSFEVSSMMKEFVKADEVVSYWVKATYANGTPLVGANITIERLVDVWSWTTVKEYNTVIATDVNGEITGNITAPDHSGEYNLEFKLVGPDGTKQRVDRWFRIRQMDVSVGFSDQFGESGLVFWEGDNVTVDVIVKDSATGESISDAEVRINVWPHCEFEEDKAESENESMGEGMGMCPPLDEMSGDTDANGVVSFMLDSEDIEAGFYDVDIEVDHYERGHVWTHKAFTVKLFDIEISGIPSEIYPGDNLTITVNVSNSTESPLPNGTFVEAGIQMLGMEYGEDMNIALEEGNLSDGSITFNLNIPLNATPGPGVFFAYAEYDNTSDEEMFFISIKGNTTIDVSDPIPPVAPGELFGINITVVDNLGLQMEPMVMHLRKIDGTIPMFEIESSFGPESGKETFYESAMYFNNESGNGTLHVMLQAQPKSGNYSAMMIFTEKGAIMTGPGKDDQFAFFNYEVIGDNEKPAVVDNLVATNMNSTGEVELEWSYSSDNVGVVKYKVYANQSAENITDVSSLSPVKIVGSLTNGTIVSKLIDDEQYCFAVTAVDAEGNENKTIVGGYCATPTAETTAPSVSLGFPSNGFEINNSNKDIISAVFNISADDGSFGPGVSGLSHYFFEISNSSDFNTSCTVNYTVKEPYLNVYLWDNIYMDLCGNGTYEWRATAYDHAGNSNVSEVWNFTLNITAVEIMFEHATFYPSYMPEDDVFLVNVTNLGAAIDLSVYDLYIFGNVEITEPITYGIESSQTLTYVVNGTSEPMFKEEDCSEGFEIGIVNRTDPDDYLAHRLMELNCV